MWVFISCISAAHLMNIQLQVIDYCRRPPVPSNFSEPISACWCFLSVWLDSRSLPLCVSVIIHTVIPHCYRAVIRLPTCFFTLSLIKEMIHSLCFQLSPINSIKMLFAVSLWTHVFIVRSITSTPTSPHSFHWWMSKLWVTFWTRTLS